MRSRKRFQRLSPRLSANHQGDAVPDVARGPGSKAGALSPAVPERSGRDLFARATLTR